MASVVNWLKKRKDVVLFEIENENDLDRVIKDLENKILTIVGKNKTV